MISCRIHDICARADLLLTFIAQIILILIYQIILSFGFLLFTRRRFEINVKGKFDKGQNF